LAAAISAGADLLAPNRLELAEVDPRAAATDNPDDLAAIAESIARRTGTSLLVSIGEDGALFTDGHSLVHGWGPELTPVNTAGAGDALLSGWLAEPGPPADRMARAIRWSRAACLAATTVAEALVNSATPGDGVTVRTLAAGQPERSFS
jgi:1-phosphofructokinase